MLKCPVHQLFTPQTLVNTFTPEVVMWEMVYSVLMFFLGMIVTLVVTLIVGIPILCWLNDKFIQMEDRENIQGFTPWRYMKIVRGYDPPYFMDSEGRIR